MQGSSFHRRDQRNFEFWYLQGVLELIPYAHVGMAVYCRFVQKTWLTFDEPSVLLITLVIVK